MSLKHISQPVNAVLARLPFEKTVRRLSNDPRQEFILECCDGLPPARQKRLIHMSRSPEVAFLDDTSADILIDALGLRAA